MALKEELTFYKYIIPPMFLWQDWPTSWKEIFFPALKLRRASSEHISEMKSKSEKLPPLPNHRHFHFMLVMQRGIERFIYREDVDVVFGGKPHAENLGRVKVESGHCFPITPLG